jgi:hypothetical protein
MRRLTLGMRTRGAIARQDCLDCLRGAVTIAFPEGLPEYDDVRQARAFMRTRTRLHRSEIERGGDGEDSAKGGGLAEEDLMAIVLCPGAAGLLTSGRGWADGCRLRLLQILLGDWERDGRTVEMFEEGEAELWWAGKQMEQVCPCPLVATRRAPPRTATSRLACRPTAAGRCVGPATNRQGKARHPLTTWAVQSGGPGLGVEAQQGKDRGTAGIEARQ